MSAALNFMKTAIFDLETFSLNADTGILLCAVIKEYGHEKPARIIRADSFPEWRKDRSNVRPIVESVLEALKGFDIFVAHNGQNFDKAMLTSWALKFDLPVALRFAKFIDPVLLCRRHLRLSRNSLASLLQFLDIDETKTPIKWESWMKAALNGDKKHLDYIVEHCVVDVAALEKAYEKTKRLVKGIDEKGSSF